MKKILWVILGIVFIIGAVLLIKRASTGEDNWICQNGTWVKHGNPSGPMPTGSCTKGQQANPQKESSLPNPASKNCVDKGGKLEIIKETAGELGICKFTDGTECEEWQFFRDECKKGQLTKADTSHPYTGVISKINGKYLFKDQSGVEYSLQLVDGENKQLKQRLDSEVGDKSETTIVAAEYPSLSKILVLKSFQEK